VDEFKVRMLEEYHALVDPLSANEREALRANWQETLADALGEEGKTLSAVARLKRAEKKMLQAVSCLFYFDFQAEILVCI